VQLDGNCYRKRPGRKRVNFSSNLWGKIIDIEVIKNFLKKARKKNM
jgi:hypothetical protein